MYLLKYTYMHTYMHTIRCLVSPPLGRAVLGFRYAYTHIYASMYIRKYTYVHTYIHTCIFSRY